MGSNAGLPCSFSQYDMTVIQLQSLDNTTKFYKLHYNNNVCQKIQT